VGKYTRAEKSMGEEKNRRRLFRECLGLHPRTPLPGTDRGARKAFSTLVALRKSRDEGGEEGNGALERQLAKDSNVVVEKRKTRGFQNDGHPDDRKVQESITFGQLKYRAGNCLA